MDLIGFLYGFGFLHGVILAGILLYPQRGNRSANVFMAALVTCIAIRFLVSWLIRAEVFTSYPQLSLLSTPLDFAWGPLLYLYAFAMSGRAVGRRQLLHFIPCALMFSAPLTFALYPREQQLEFLGYFWGNRENLEFSRDILTRMPAFWRIWVDLHLHGSFFAIQFGIYCYLVLRQIHNHNLNLERHFSFTDQMNLRWLRILTYMCTFPGVIPGLQSGQIGAVWTFRNHRTGAQHALSFSGPGYLCYRDSCALSASHSTARN